MKFIKTFESLKDQTNIGDLLLEFEDSGEISNLRVSGGDFKIAFVFDFREDLVGLDKLRVLDRIISRLRRKYPFIYIEDDKLHIDLVKQDRKYITGSLVTEVQDILKEKLTDLNIFTSKKFSNCIFYGKTKEKILLKYNTKNKTLSIDYNTGWCIFYGMYKLIYKDIESLWQYAFVNTLQIEVSNISPSTNVDDV